VLAWGCWCSAGAQRRAPQRGGPGRHGLAGMHAWLKVAGQTWADHFHDGQGTGPTKAQAETAAVRAWADVTAWELRAALGRDDSCRRAAPAATAISAATSPYGPASIKRARRAAISSLRIPRRCSRADRPRILGVIRADLIWSAPERLRHQS
jgi:hypothetical protein